MTGARGTAEPGSAKLDKASDATHRIVTTFDDNRLLPQLLGEFDANLALIEARLGVRADAQGKAARALPAFDQAGDELALWCPKGQEVEVAGSRFHEFGYLRLC